MSYCLNPECRKPYNPSGTRFCQSCGTKLLLGDRYRALQPIGQGGFGKTFLAVDEYKPSQPQCVIKQFFPQVASSNIEKAAELFQTLADQGVTDVITEFMLKPVDDKELAAQTRELEAIRALVRNPAQRGLLGLGKKASIEAQVVSLIDNSSTVNPGFKDYLKDRGELVFDRIATQH